MPVQDTRELGPHSKCTGQKETGLRKRKPVVWLSVSDCRDVVAPRQSRDCYLTLMATVAELARVSVPPGPKVTVPVGESVCPDVPAAGVTLTVTIMV